MIQMISLMIRSNWHLENPNGLLLGPNIFHRAISPMPVLTVSEEFQEGLVTLDVPKFLAARPQCPSRRIPCC